MKSRIRRGLQRRGTTQIDSSIYIEETKPLELTVHQGTFADVDGETYTLPSDATVNPSPPDSGTKKIYVALVNPQEPQIEVLEHTPSVEPHVPELNGDLITLLVGWNWLTLPADADSFHRNYAFTWIDNIPVKSDGRETVFIGESELGKQYKIWEIEHFAVRKGEGGIVRWCPACGLVDDDLTIMTEEQSEQCGYCENQDTVPIKDCRKKAEG